MVWAPDSTDLWAPDSGHPDLWASDSRGQLTLGRAIELFLAAKAAEGASPRTIEWYRMIIGRAVRRFGEARPVDAVAAAELRAWLVELRTTLAPVSVAGYVRTLRVLGNWLAAEGLAEAAGLAMLPPLEAERRLPEISIYGDGSVLVPAQVAEVPGPAGYDLESFHIDGGRLDQIISTAQSVGLRGPERRLEQEGPQFVADAGYTVVTVAADGARHVTRAAALFDAPDGSRERQSLAQFVEDLRALRGADRAKYQPIMLAVYVAAPDPGFQPDPASAQEVEWPFADPLSTWGQPVPPIMIAARCAVVSGDVLEAALPSLRAATSATVFVDAVGDRAIAAVRPLLPDEDACEDVSAR